MEENKGGNICYGYASLKDTTYGTASGPFGYPRTKIMPGDKTLGTFGNEINNNNGNT